MTQIPPWAGPGAPPPGPPRPPGPAGPPGYPPPAYGAFPAAGGWGRLASAPAPGDVPLRPLGAGEILSGSFTLIRQSPGATLGLAAILISVLAVLLAAVIFAASRTVPAVGLLAVPVALAGAALLSGSLVAAIGSAYLGRRLSLREAVRRSGAGWVLAAMTLLALASAALWIPLILLLKGWAVLVLLPLTAWLGIMVSLTVPVVTLEHRRAVAAVARSWRLVLRRYWRTLGIYLLSYLVCDLLGYAIGLPFLVSAGIVGSVAGNGGPGRSFAVALGAVFAVFEIVLTTVTTSINTGVLVLVYADARMRREGMDLLLRQTAQDRELTGEEFAATSPGGRRRRPAPPLPPAVPDLR